MKKCFLAFLIISFFLLSPFSSPINAFEGASSKHILENGLTILISEMPTSPMVSVYGYVKAGSATEGKYLGTGISHFLEHMLFKGTTSRSVGQIAAQVQAVGGSINASTGMDYTIYTLTVPFDAFDMALDILADVLMNSTMDPDEVEKERDVIFGEMRMRNDNPDSKISELVYRNAYLRHPYKHPIIGYKSLLAKVSREDIVDYYQDYYTPNNIIISLAGNIQTQDVLPKVKEAFKSFQRQSDIPRNLPQEPPQISLRRYEETYPTDLTRLSMAFSSTPLLHKDLYALDVLAGVLGQGGSSRLYLEIYKKQNLVHRISASNYTPIDRGLFEINALLEKKHTDEVIQATLQQIAFIQAKGIRPKELEKSKRQSLSDHVMSQQTSSHVAYSQALDEAFTGDFHFSEKYVEGIKAVTNKDIIRVANQYLNEPALTISILNPEQKEPAAPESSKNNAMGEIKKYTLENGLTVLIRENPTFPLVSVRLMCNGGTRQEGSFNNGISTLTASLWTKGTKSLSAQQIAETTESLGMRLGGYSGKNSLGLSLEALSEDLPRALNLLIDLVKNPDFPEEEINKVKIHMKTALRQRNDNIFRFTSHVLKETLFQHHPFRLDKNGTMESIDHITPEDIDTFYHQWVVPNNMVLTLFGDIDSEEALKDIRKKFGSLRSKPLTLKTHQENPPDTLREKALTMRKEQAMVMFGFQGTSLKHPDRYGLEILSSILGSSFSGRLFSSIREELGQAYTLGGSYSLGIDTGFIYFYVLTTEENVQPVKDLVQKEIQKLQTEPVSEKELNDIKAYLKGEFKSGYETNASLSFITGLDELYGLGFENYQMYDTKIHSVTKEDIQRLARKYLNVNQSVIVVTTPIKK